MRRASFLLFVLCCGCSSPPVDSHEEPSADHALPGASPQPDSSRFSLTLDGKAWEVPPHLIFRRPPAPAFPDLIWIGAVGTPTRNDGISEATLSFPRTLADDSTFSITIQTEDVLSRRSDHFRSDLPALSIAGRSSGKTYEAVSVALEGRIRRIHQNGRSRLVVTFNSTLIDPVKDRSQEMHVTNGTYHSPWQGEAQAPRSAQVDPPVRFSASIDGKAWNADPGHLGVLPGGTALFRNFRLVAHGDKSSGRDGLDLMFPDFSGTDTTIHHEKTDKVAGLMLSRANGQLFTASTFDLYVRKGVSQGWMTFSGTFSATEKDILQHERDVPITNGIFEGRIRMTDSALDEAKDPERHISADLDGIPWEGKPAAFVSLVYLEDGQWTWETQMMFNPEAVKRDGIASMIVQLPYFTSDDTAFHLDRYREKKGIRLFRTVNGKGRNYFNEGMDLRIDKRRVGDRVALTALISGSFKCEDASMPVIRISHGRLACDGIKSKKDAPGTIEELSSPR